MKSRLNMRQLFQNLKSGETEMIECPYPKCNKGHLIVQTRYSLISLGTERMLVEFSKSGLISKARQQPEKVKQIIDKVKTDGLLPTIDTVLNRLDEPIPLGYCNAGTVVEIGDGVTEFSVGDFVVSNGPHAEIVSVSKNLAAKIPEGVDFRQAVFTVAASIGLQGIRLAMPTLGETFVVIGMGLIGQLTAQLAKATGCRVLAFDLDQSKIKVAVQAGIEAFVHNDPVDAVMSMTNGNGADSVLITASSKSELIISQAARMSRKRGRIVLIGVVPLKLSRAEFYEKELSFQVSCSYGPGRYDYEYEQKGSDYPLPFVRWTEKRNFDAVLQCMASKTLVTDILISGIAEFDKSPEVYNRLNSTKSIATILEYDKNEPRSTSIKVKLRNENSEIDSGDNTIAILGSGNFTKMTLLPLMKKTKIPIRCIASQSGTYGALLAKKYQIPSCTTSTEDILRDKNIRCVFITTRHHNHSSLVLKILKNRKHVFVEKPLAIDREQLRELQDWFQNENEYSCTVGFNRRYSPLAIEAKKLLGETPPQINFVYMMNAGAIPLSHWLQKPEEGGRIIGEACHCIDLFLYFSGSPIISVMASSLGTDTNLMADSVTIHLKSSNGSMGTVHYFSNGSKQFQKEKFELFFNNRVITVDNFRYLRTFGMGKNVKRKLASSDKGHKKQFEIYSQFLLGKTELLSTIKEHINVTDASIAAVDSLREKSWIDLSSAW